MLIKVNSFNSISFLINRFLFGTDWVSKESLESVLLESLTDSQVRHIS
jgi:hypothetical protein